MSVRRRASGRAHYNYFRDYDPTVGRYVESDPIGLLGGSHSTFTYAYDDPLKFVDPSGLAPPGGAVDFRNFIRDAFYGGNFPERRRSSIKQVIEILQRRASDMQKKNFIDGDKFYHCLAMCEAASLGPLEASIAATAGIIREMNQQYRRGEPSAECAADNAANGLGIDAGRRGKDCVASCSVLMPPGMVYP